jgi:hypothetical protein
VEVVAGKKTIRCITKKEHNNGIIDLSISNNHPLQSIALGYEEIPCKVHEKGEYFNPEHKKFDISFDDNPRIKASFEMFMKENISAVVINNLDEANKIDPEKYLRIIASKISALRLKHGEYEYNDGREDPESVFAIKEKYAKLCWDVNKLILKNCNVGKNTVGIFKDIEQIKFLNSYIKDDFMFANSLEKLRKVEINASEIENMKIFHKAFLKGKNKSSIKQRKSDFVNVTISDSKILNEDVGYLDLRGLNELIFDKSDINYTRFIMLTRLDDLVRLERSKIDFERNKTPLDVDFSRVLRMSEAMPKMERLHIQGVTNHLEFLKKMPVLHDIDGLQYRGVLSEAELEEGKAEMLKIYNQEVDSKNVFSKKNVKNMVRNKIYDSEIESLEFYRSIGVTPVQRVMMESEMTQRKTDEQVAKFIRDNKCIDLDNRIKDGTLTDCFEDVEGIILEEVEEHNVKFEKFGGQKYHIGNLSPIGEQESERIEKRSGIDLNMN